MSDDESIAGDSDYESGYAAQLREASARGGPLNYHPPDPWGGVGRVVNIPRMFSATREGRPQHFWILRERLGIGSVMYSLFRQEERLFDQSRGPVVRASKMASNLYCIEDGHPTAPVLRVEERDRCFAELAAQGSKFTLSGACR